MRKRKYLFEAEISVDGFVVKTIDLVAEFTYTPTYKGRYEDGLQIEPDEDEEIEIENILANYSNPTPDQLIIAKMLDTEMDKDQLIDEIMNDWENTND